MEGMAHFRWPAASSECLKTSWPALPAKVCPGGARCRQAPLLPGGAIAGDLPTGTSAPAWLALPPVSAAQHLRAWAMGWPQLKPSLRLTDILPAASSGVQ